MNEALQDFAKKEILNGLKQCTKKQVQTFRQMYAYKNPDWTIKQVVESILEDKLDWAMQQVANTIKKEK